MSHGPTKRNPGCWPATRAWVICGVAAALRGDAGAVAEPDSCAHSAGAVLLGLQLCFCDPGAYRRLLSASIRPLPLYIRVLLPFTYYLCYQYAVIARSYALIAPLLFIIAAIYTEATRRLAWMTVLLGLLAGVSVHGFLISVCIWVTLYGPALLGEGTPGRKKLAIAGLIYCCILIFYLFCAWPAKDVAFAEHRGLSNLRLLPEITKAGLAGAFIGHWIPSLILIALSAPFLWRGGGWRRSCSLARPCPSGQSSTHNYGTSAFCFWLGCLRSGSRHIRRE